MTKQVVCHVACLWIVCILADSGSSIIKAADYSWAAPVGGDFSTPSNWNPAGPPGSADTALFNLGSPGAGYSVFDGTSSVSLSQIDVDNDTVTFGGGFSYVATSPTFPAISFGNNPGDVANVTIDTPAGMVGMNDAIGYAAQTQATATLMSHSSWQSENLYVGYAGTGTMALETASVTATASEVIGSQVGSQGTMTLDNESSLTIAPPLNNSVALVVGASGTGTLSVKSGTVSIGDQVVIGQNAMSQGTLTLDGAGSQLQSTPTPGLAMTGLTIGQSGNGSMSVTGGATARIAGVLVIGQNVGSLGTLSVANAQSSLSYEGSASTASVTIGASGQGALSVTNGGSANLAGPVVVGQAKGAVGTVSIDGTKSTFTSSSAVGGGLSVTIGAAGQGTFSLTGGGAALLSGAIDVGQLAGASGTITVAGAKSTLQAGNPVTIGDSGTGLLSISSGGNASVSNVILGQNALSQGTVSVDGANSQFSGNDLTVGGAGTGTVTITNGGKLSSLGSTVIGTSSGSTGSVSVTGPGSSLSVPSSAVIGQAGTGALSGTDGATITCGGMQLGVLSGSGGSPQGTLSLDGAGTSMTSGNSVIGNGSVSITGGALWSTNSVVVDPYTGQSGAIVVDGAGSRWTSSGGITIEAANLLTGTSVTVSNGASMTTNTLDNYDTIVDIQKGTITASTITNHFGVIIDNGTIQGNVTLLGGQLSGTGTISGTLRSLGTIAPGNSPGTLTVGSLSLYASTIPSFNFEINSATGTAGGTTGWNLLSSQGGVSLLAPGGNGTTFHIELTSLTQNNTPGAVSDFDPTTGLSLDLPHGREPDHGLRSCQLPHRYLGLRESDPRSVQRQRNRQLAGAQLHRARALDARSCSPASPAWASWSGGGCIAVTNFLRCCLSLNRKPRPAILPGGALLFRSGDCHLGLCH